jgi:hypothetical protein
MLHTEDDGLRLSMKPINEPDLLLYIRCILMDYNPLCAVIPRTVHKNSKLYKLYHDIQVKYSTYPLSFRKMRENPVMHNGVGVLFLDCLDHWLSNHSRCFFPGRAFDTDS